MSIYTTSSRDETATLGRTVAGKMGGGEVICLSGELGSGKTVFVTGFVHYFLPHIRVLSPTFTLIRKYQTHQKNVKHIYHLDLYRLSESADILSLGVQEYVNRPDTVVLIEWPEKVPELSVKKRMFISFSIADEMKRVITIHE